MSIKRIVISGSPGGGKTSLIRELSLKGYSVFEEFSRILIQQGQEEGEHNAFLSDPHLFSNRLFEGRKAQYFHNLGSNLSTTAPVAFYDRGIHDIYAYLNAIGKHTLDWENKIAQYQYDLVFLVEPWEAIYQQDEQRLETFEQAKAYFPFILSAYKLNHKVVIVPKDTIQTRVSFIESYLQTLAND